MKSKAKCLKCGGPTKKKKGSNKFADGTKDTDKKKFFDPLKDALGNIDLNDPNTKKTASGISDMISGNVTGILDSKKNSLISGIDNRENPSSIMNKTNNLDTASSLVSGTAKGFAVAGIPGAIGGFVLSGLGRILSASARENEKDKATEDWSNSWSAKTAANLKTSGYSKGGPTKDEPKKIPLPVGKDKNYIYDPNKKQENNVRNYYMRPMDDRSYYTEASKAGIISGLTFDDWNKLPKEEKIKSIDKEKGYHYTEGNTGNVHGIKWWVRDTLNTVNPKTFKNSRFSDQYFDAVKKTKYPEEVSGMKKGGSIEGKGTGKSDSISMKAPEGSFIVPTENSGHAEELGKSYLGWDKEEKAKRNNGGTDIKVSNGEVFFTPEEVNTLKYHGIDLDELAPKAENKIEMKKGGLTKEVKEVRNKPGGSNVGKKTFANGEKRHGPYVGTAGGAPKGSYPIPDKKHAIAALRLAGHAPNPAGIRAKVHAKYPDLGKKKVEGGLIQMLKVGGPIMGFKKGTKTTDITPEWVHDKNTDLVINDATKTAYDKTGAEYTFSQPLDDVGNPLGDGKYIKLRSASPYGSDIYSKTIGSTDEDTPEWMKNLPELSGVLQVAGGAAGLMAAGKVPNMEVSHTLKKLSGEVRKLAEFGYEPSVLNALNNEIENTRVNLSKIVENEGQNSGLEKMAKLNSLLTTTIDKKAGLAFANAAEKSRKWADVLKVDALKSNQEFDINKIKIDDWYKNQEVFAGLVTAGISNIVGARQLKSEQDNLRKIGNNNPSFKS